MAILIIMIILIALFILTKYNTIIKLRNKVRQSESGIDVYLNQRFDLVPNLVECVKAYAKHESELIESITKMRTQYVKSKKNTLKDSEELNNNVNRLIAVAENYPELKASEQYLNLQKTLSKLESQLQAARRIYNNEVTNYNTKITVVPNNIIAKIFGFQEAILFEIEKYKKENINVKDNINE